MLRRRTARAPRNPLRLQHSAVDAGGLEPPTPACRVDPDPEEQCRLLRRVCRALSRLEEHLTQIQDLLELRTERSALLLRRLLGRIRLEPTEADIGRPYYMARTSIDALALLGAPAGPDGGSNSLHWWRRRESNPGPRNVRRSRLRVCPSFDLGEARHESGRSHPLGGHRSRHPVAACQRPVASLLMSPVPL